MLPKLCGFLFIAWCCLQPISCLSEEMQELADMLHATCVGETGVSEDKIENARKGDFADEEPLKCYIKCIMAQMACIDDDGTIDVDATVAVVPEEYKEAAEPIIRKCGSKVGASPCENAWLTHQCYQKESPEAFTEEQEAMIAYLHQMCTQSTSVSEDAIENARHGDFADDDKLKCYIYCVMKESGCADDDGIVDAEALLEILPEEYRATVADAVKNCVVTDSSYTACERVWLGHKCFQHANPEMYFLP